MILPGHVALAALAAKGTGVDLPASLAASMAPDLVDKPLRWLLRATPNDRIPAHTLLFWAGSTALVWALSRRERRGALARGWAVGYGAHLAGDHLNSYLNPGRIYPLWPFKRYRLHRGPTGLHSSLDDFSPASLLLEGAAVAVALLAWAAGLFGDRRRAD